MFDNGFKRFYPMVGRPSADYNTQAKAFMKTCCKSPWLSGRLCRCTVPVGRVVTTM